MYCPADLLIFDISLLYYYNNFRSSIMLCLFSGDKYLSLGISLSYLVFFFTLNCFWTTLWWNSWDFCNFVSDFITNQITSWFGGVLNFPFWNSFKWIYCGVFSIIKKILTVGFLLLRLLLIFSQKFFLIFLAKRKNL